MARSRRGLQPREGGWTESVGSRGAKITRECESPSSHLAALAHAGLYLAWNVPPRRALNFLIPHSSFIIHRRHSSRSTGELLRIFTLMHLLDRIEKHGRTSPDRLAHVSGERRMIYGELLAKSSALAAWLDSQLGDKRSPVAVRGHKEPEMLVSFMAAVKSGRPHVPIDYSTPEQRMERVIEIAGVGLVLTPEKVGKSWRRAGGASAEAGRSIGSFLHPLHERQHR